jgi:hypothetical protein
VLVSIARERYLLEDREVWPAPGLDDTDLSESGLPLELDGA